MDDPPPKTHAVGQTSPPAPRPPRSEARNESRAGARRPPTSAQLQQQREQEERQQQLYHFLLTFKVEKGVEFTHTSFMRPAGAFYIPTSRMDEFYELYGKALHRGEDVYLTEKHRHLGPVVIDLDFRYDVPSALPAAPIELRRHTQAHVDAIVRSVCRAVTHFTTPDARGFQVFVMEKPEPVVASTTVKDGLHIVIPDIVTRPSVQYMMRNVLLEDVTMQRVLAELGTTNAPRNCIDEEVIEKNNWMMHGSKKPNAEPYRVTHLFECRTSAPRVAGTREEGGDPAADVPGDKGGDKGGGKAGGRQLLRLDAPAPGTFVTQEQHQALVERLSIRNKYEETPTRSDRAADVAAFQADMDEKHRRRMVCRRHVYDANYERENTSDSFETARKLAQLLDVARADNYSDWMRMGWCLRNIDHRLLQTWEEVSRRSSKYLEGECPLLWGRMRQGSLGIGTLHMWAKSDNPGAYRELLRNDLFDIIQCSSSGTHHDVARVVHHMYRYDYVCASIARKKWYQFRDHRWVPSDSAGTLRRALSTDVYSEFIRVVAHHTNQLSAAASEEFELGSDGGGGGGDERGAGGSDGARLVEKQKKHQDMCRSLLSLAGKLKDVRFKDNVMRECCELFYEEHFEEKLDSNPYLIGFPNGVYDLDNQEFREGRTDDYMSFNAGVPYIPYDANCEPMQELLRFWEQVLPNKAVRDYMLTTLSSFLCGFTREERFHVWTGTGSNGKSKVIELFEKAFGEYCIKFPVTLITGKRPASNQATSEIARCKGKRFGVMQEPSNGESLNVGILKEMTGGDRIQARALFCEPIEFKPQIKIALLCNDLPNVPSDDGGTWRRIRVVQFGSKFVPHKPTKPNEFPMNDRLSQSFDEWAPHFMSLLVEYYKVYSAGRIVEPEEVLRCTREYQKENDHYTEFVDSCLERSEEEAGDYLLLDDIFQQFRDWVRSNNIPISVPKKKVVRNYMDRHLGALVNERGPDPGYRNVRIRDRQAHNRDALRDADD